MPVSPAPLDPSLLLTLVFAVTLTAGLLLKLWLNSRQIRHVAQHRQHVPIAFANTITLPAHQKAADYTMAKARLGLIELAIGASILLGWTLLGGLSILNAALMSTLGSGLIQQVALLAAFVVINGLLELPLSWYQTFVVESRFGFNKTTPRLWLLDLLKSSGLGAAIGLPIAALILWVMDATGSLWWFWTWAVWMGFNLLLLLIYPSLIAPLFNKFTPLKDEALKSRVTALMARCGFAAEGLYVMDGSKRSAHANAYFTGFGASKRVVFYDTLLAKLSPNEVDAVLAHELGHFTHKHVLKRIVAMFSMSLLGLALLGWLATKVWFFTGLGVYPNLNTSNSALSLLLFMLVIPAFSFFISPLFARLSRQHEFEADAYAMAKTSGPDLASALLKLYEDNAATITPDPVYVQFYYSHPPASERLSRMAA
jgi:STE24 endopeptidase